MEKQPFHSYHIPDWELDGTTSKSQIVNELISQSQCCSDIIKMITRR